MNENKKLAKQKPVNRVETYTQQPVQPTVPKAGEWEEQPPAFKQQYAKPEPIIEGLDDLDDLDDIEEMLQEPVQPVTQQVVQPTMQQVEQPVRQEPVEQPMMQQTAEPVVQEIVQPVKRGRGRPRKNPVSTITETNDSLQSVNPVQPAKRGRGRPRKNPDPVPEIQEQPEDMVLPGLGVQEVEDQEPEENFLPGFYDEETPISSQTISNVKQEQEAFLPGFDDEEDEEDDMILPGLGGQNFEDKEEMVLPGLGLQDFDDDEEEEAIFEPRMESQSRPQTTSIMPNNYDQNANSSYHTNVYDVNSYDTNSYGNKVNSQEQETYEEIDLSNLLTPDKKIVTFVGTGKNGTSFIVNNIAELMSSIGINVAILDTTQNRNSYYIYTKNEEPLREIATHSIEGLAQGIARGIGVNKNLMVYTSLPDENNAIKHVDKILETLLQKHSLILIDTDFDTPLGYFKQSQETYLVQSMDILTIQPLTAFLKELKVKNILDESKLRVVLNKVVKIRGIKDETIIGGMAFYNDPAMSFMTELFDRDRIKYVSIPFEEETYIRYLEGIIECEISLKGYSKMFVQTLRELGNMIYPIVNSAPRNSRNYQPPSAQANNRGNFSSNMNHTLDKMRKF